MIILSIIYIQRIKRTLNMLIIFLYTSSFIRLSYVTTKLMDSNSYCIIMSCIPTNQDYYS